MSKGDIVVAQQDEIQVFVSEAGYVCVKQVSWSMEESIVSISAEHVEAVVSALRASVEEAKKVRVEWIMENDDDNS